MNSEELTIEADDKTIQNLCYAIENSALEIDALEEMFIFYGFNKEAVTDVFSKVRERIG